MLQEFSQREELTTRLRSILRDYPLGTSTLCEFLQNADDARAQKFAFVIDRRGDGIERGGEFALTPDEVGVPALFAWSDAAFTDADFAGIISLGASGKAKDSTRIGRFGIGFNSCYHLTDCPSFVSGSSLVVFDPHGTRLPNGSHGLRMDFCSDREARKRYKTQLEVFNGMTNICRGPELDGSPANGENVNGAIFHFPLRSKTSLLSDTLISVEQLVEMLDGFAEAVPEALLFLKHVREVRVLERIWDEETGKFEIREIHETRVVPSPTEYALAKYSECEAVEKLFEARTHVNRVVCSYALEQETASKQNDRASSTFQMALESTEYDEQGRTCKSRSSQWLLHGALDKSDKARKLAKNVGQVPWTAIAMRVGSNETVDKKSKQTPVRGKAYCFLPLPIETGLPVHINGFFVSSSNRRELERSDGVATSQSGNANGEWNQHLLCKALPTIYGELMETAARLNALRPGFAPVEILWPWQNEEFDSLHETLPPQFEPLAIGVMRDAIEQNRSIFFFPLLNRKDPSDQLVADSSEESGRFLGFRDVVVRDSLFKGTYSALDRSLREAGLFTVYFPHAFLAVIDRIGLGSKIVRTSPTSVARALRQADKKQKGAFFDLWNLQGAKELLEYMGASDRALRLRIAEARYEADSEGEENSQSEDVPVAEDILLLLDGLRVIPVSNGNLEAFHCPRQANSTLYVVLPPSSSAFASLPPDLLFMARLDMLPELHRIWHSSGEAKDMCNLALLTPETMVKSGLLNCLLPQKWIGHEIVFCVSSPDHVRGIPRDVELATAAHFAALDSSGPKAKNVQGLLKSDAKPMTKRERKRKEKEAGKSRRAMKKSGKHIVGVAEAEKHLEAARPRSISEEDWDKVLVSAEELARIRERIGLVWQIVADHAVNGTTPNTSAHDSYVLSAKENVLAVLFSKYPVLLMQEGFACTVAYAQERGVLVSWQDESDDSEGGHQWELETLRRFGILTCDSSLGMEASDERRYGMQRAQEAALNHKGRRHALASVKRALAQNDSFVPCADGSRLAALVLRWAKRDELLVSASAVRCLPVFETRKAGTFVALVSPIPETKKQRYLAADVKLGRESTSNLLSDDLTKHIKACLPPSEQEWSKFGFLCPSRILKSDGDAAEILRVAGAEHPPRLVDFIQEWLSPVLRALAGNGEFRDSALHLKLTKAASVHIFDTVAKLKFHSTKQTSQGRRVLDTLRELPLVQGNHGKFQRICHFVDPEDSLFRTLLGHENSSDNTSNAGHRDGSSNDEGETVPQAYRIGQTLQLMRALGLLSLADKRGFFLAAERVMSTSNFSGGRLLASRLVREWDTVYSKWDASAKRRIGEIAFVPAERFCSTPAHIIRAGKPDWAGFERSLRSKQMAKVRNPGVSRAAKRTLNKRQIQDLIEDDAASRTAAKRQADLERSSRFEDGDESYQRQSVRDQGALIDFDGILVNASERLAAAAVLFRGEKSLHCHGGPCNCTTTLVPLSSASSFRGSRSSVTSPTSQFLSLQVNTAVSWRNASILPKFFNDASPDLLATFPRIYPVRLATIAEHLSRAAADWGRQTRYWRSNYADWIKGTSLACLGMLARELFAGKSNEVDGLSANSFDPSVKGLINSRLANCAFVLLETGELCHAANVCVDLEEDASSVIHALPLYLHGLEPLLVHIGAPTMQRDHEPTISVCAPNSAGPSAIYDGILNSFNDKSLADVEFIVIDEESGTRHHFYGHRIILSCASSYFANMYTSGMADARSRLHTIEMDSWVDPRSFMMVLRYIYTGSVSDLHDPSHPAHEAMDENAGFKVIDSTNVEHILCLLRLADMFFMKRLVELCEQWVADVVVIDVYNVCSLLTHATACNAKQLTRLCIYHIRTLFDIIKSMPQYLDLPQEAKEMVIPISSAKGKTW